MGLNYAIVVSTLFEFKDRLVGFRSNKNSHLIEFFEKSKHDPSKEDVITPTLKDIATAIGMERSKVNSLVKELYHKLLESFYDKPIEYKRCVTTIHISIPWDEMREIENKEYEEYVTSRILEVDAMLPVVPRIGETISLEFLDRNFRYTHGYVHDISHNLSSSTQRIIVFVHPFNNYYYKWSKLKNDHDRQTRLRRSEK